MEIDYIDVIRITINQLLIFQGDFSYSGLGDKAPSTDFSSAKSDGINNFIFIFNQIICMFKARYLVDITYNCDYCFLQFLLGPYQR